MPRFSFVTVDVFTDKRFGGNPLAVFPDARGMSDADMQALAAEFNLSETTFVLPPADPDNTARVRIFNRRAEMPFAGHPNVGTGWVLAKQGRAKDGRLRFEEIAGLVEIEVGDWFTIAEVTGEALTRATPDIGQFREAAKNYTAMGPNRLPLYLYAHDGARIRTRMFSPLSGTVEDAATGSAATPLAALLLSLTPAA